MRRFPYPFARAVRLLATASVLISCNGDRLAAPAPLSAVPSAQPLTTAAADPAPVIYLTEIYANSQSSASPELGEWFELYNAGSAPVDLFGFQISSGPSNPATENHTIGAHLIVDPDHCVVLGNSADPNANFGAPVNYAYPASGTGSITLNNNNTDWIVIRSPTPASTVLDSVAYATRTGTVGNFTIGAFSGFGTVASFEINDIASHGSTLASGNWTRSANTFNANIKGTPGTCPQNTSGDPVLKTINVTATTLNVGENKQIVAVGLDQRSQPLAPQPTFSWTSSDENKLTIDAATGVATGKALGSVTVTASAGGKSGSATVTVSDPPTLTTIVVTPTSINVTKHAQLVASGHDQNNQPLATQPTFTWSSTDATIVNVDANTGDAFGARLGSTTVTASAGGKSGSATINVVDPDAAGSISLSSKNQPRAFPAGFIDPLFATVKRADGSTISSPNLTWSSSDVNIATVDAGGYVTGVSAGTVTITVTATNGVHNSIGLTVLPHSAPTSAIYRDNLSFGTPTDADPSDDIIVARPQFTLSYNALRGTPNWVAWDLNASHMASIDRCDCFTPDPLLPANVYHVVDADYLNGLSINGVNVYARGHMTMSAERSTTDQENAVTFYVTNVVPQENQNNTGPWLKFETFLNDQAKAPNNREIYIIAGPQWGPSPTSLKNEGKVFIPDYTWKIAVAMTSGQGAGDVHTPQDVKVYAVRIPNLATSGAPESAIGIQNRPWEDFQVTVRSLEQSTGYNFLNALPRSIQALIETKDQAPSASLVATYTTTEGGSVQLDASASSDPDAGDVLTYTWNFGDGSGPVTTADPRPAHQYRDNGTFNVTVTVTDKEGAESSANATVTVTNLPPSATFDAPESVTEGASITLRLTGATDPSPIDAASLSFAFDCGDGHYSAASPTPTATCPTSDDGDRAVRAKVIDKDGAEVEYTGTVHVTNVAPTATLNAPASVKEGETITVSLTGIVDPSAADVQAGLQVAFDCGTGGGFAAASTATSVACPTTDNGSRTVAARITDKNGAFTDYTRTVTITNVAPTGTFSAPDGVDETKPIALSVSGVTDPSSADIVAGVTIAFNCGAGYGAAGSATSLSCPTTDNANLTVGVRLTDKDGGVSEYTKAVVVANVAPAVRLAFTTPLTIGSGLPVGILGTFTDPGPDSPWSYSIDWGNGGPSTGTRTNQTVPIVGAHQYFAAGTYTLKLSVTDKDGGVGTTAATVTINRRVIDGEVNPKSTKLNDNGNGNITVRLSSTGGVDVSDIDVSTVRIGTVEVEKDNQGRYKSNLERGGDRLSMDFTRKSLIDAGVLMATTTEIVVMAKTKAGVEIVSRIAVDVK